MGKGIIGKRLEELVEVDDRFQNSINIQLDLNKRDKVLSYIPTKSSVDILQRYIKNISKDTKEKSTILIGPYGKGKSHLILVLLSLISMGYEEEEQVVIEELCNHIRNVSEDTYEMIMDIRTNKKRFLPIIISNTQMDLNQAYLIGLNEALKRENLTSIAPDTFYTEAVDMIENWRKDFKSAYDYFCECLAEEKKKIDDLIIELGRCDKKALELFSKIYPKVTAGSTFNPMINMDVKILYQNVNEVLCNEYGYSGMFIIFDEFSKFIEGHNQDTISADMKILQDICEVANSSKGNQIHTLFVAHKAIKQYNNVLPKEVINAFTGVEGRLKEILFISSSQNNYELIQNAIHKKASFKEQCSNSDELQEEFDESYSIPAFKTLFEKDDFRRIVVEGCFPLTPCSAYLLLGISEKVAQNERTLFTFISKDEPYSMARIIKSHTEKDPFFITADNIYDYFKSILKTDTANAVVHAEWLKADYALKRIADSNGDEAKVIKTLAILNIMNRVDDIPPVERYLGLASGLKKDVLKKSLENLKQAGLIEYRMSTERYYFKNNIAVNLEREIKRKKAALPVKWNMLEVLSKIVIDYHYEMPKMHNQDKCIKRYFDYKFMNYEDFMELSSTRHLFEEKISDGKIILIISSEKVDCAQIQEKTNYLNDKRVVVIASKHAFLKEDKVKQYQALQLLKEDDRFLANNKILEEEITLIEEEIKFEINRELNQMYNFATGATRVSHVTMKKETIKNGKEFNRFISSICNEVYCDTPIINNEMINKNHISSQIKTARKNLIDKLLYKQDIKELMESTSPEASVARATLIKSGVASADYAIQSGVQKVLKEIMSFISISEENKVSFTQLYEILTNAPYGMRLGVIPIYFAFSLRKNEVMPIIYQGDREVRVDSDVLSRINENPESYSLYIVKGTNERITYLANLKNLFIKHYLSKDEEENGIVQVAMMMQRWMRGLSSVASSFERDSLEIELTEDEFLCLQDMRKILKKIEVNARELLFERIPKVLKCESLEQCYRHIEQIKKVSDIYVDKLSKEIVVETKKIFSIDFTDDLCNGFKEWYGKQSESAKNVLINTKVSNFMHYITTIDTFDEKEIVNCIAKICIDMHVENWREGSLQEYKESLFQLKQEIEMVRDEAVEGKSKFTLSTKDGEIVKYFDSDIDDSISYFLKNALESTMDEFGESLEVNQKVSVLVQLINDLIK